MANTVNNAFKEFMLNVVNLDENIMKAARSSRDNLLSNIAEFDGNDFFDLCESFNVHFGSFARKTKCRELDDIDLMIGIAAFGATYFSDDPWYNVKICGSLKNESQKKCNNDDGTLNSTKVTNLFKSKLGELRDYARSEIKRNGEAVTLNLISKEWSFDIVPCFHTVTEFDGRSYYLIPNGEGNWKKTDPIKDRNHVTTSNQNNNGRVLELIRLCKKWNKVKNAQTMSSYLLETMVIDFCDSSSELSQYMDLRFRDCLFYIMNNIERPIYDMKEIQGDINSLDAETRISLKRKAQVDYYKAMEAIEAEVNENNQRKAINKWGEIFGGDFPKYDD